MTFDSLQQEDDGEFGDDDYYDDDDEDSSFMAQVMRECMNRELHVIMEEQSETETEA